MPGPPPTFPLYDRLLGGSLVEYLTDKRAEGLTHGQIAAALFDEHAVNVSGETIRRWCIARAIPDRPSGSPETAEATR